MEIGRFKGDYNEMQLTGGLLVFTIPSNILDFDNLILVVKVEYENTLIPLMIESEWDFVLESNRGITLGSGCTADISARVYHLNKQAPNVPVRLSVDIGGDMGFLSNRNDLSPIVCNWKEVQRQEYILYGSTQNYPKEILLSTDTKGNVKATLEAINLEGSPKIFDPVKGKYVHENLDWDRFYGNYVYLEIDNDSRIFQKPHVEQIEIAVRVLHIIEQEDMPEEPSFNKDISKLFSYYLRYFLWLHAGEQPEVPKEVPSSEIKNRDTYSRFPNLESYEEMKNSEVVSDLIKRLSLDENEFRKMPRSRDFPIGGIGLLQRWLDKGMPK